ncbi:hypothetical protein QYF61_013360, partial [Mycteria americana]
MVEVTTGLLETYPVNHATTQNTILGLERQVLWREGSEQVAMWDCSLWGEPTLEQRKSVRRKERQREKNCYVLNCKPPSPSLPCAAQGGRGVWSEGVKLSLGKVPLYNRYEALDVEGQSMDDVDDGPSTTPEVLP